jgi:hypothetical protein
MKASRNNVDSWEKQTCYDLENGWSAIVEFSPIYQNHITRLDNPERTTYWHCSNGLTNLPEFAKPWIRGGDGPDHRLVNPQFQIVKDTKYGISNAES